MFSIGALARETGVKVPTIRYYEQIGLIEEPARTAGNQRRYVQGHVERLRFIRHARELGLPLEAIRELLGLSDAPDQPCAQADQLVQQHLDAVRARIARLQRLERELARMAQGCAAQQARDCYVLQSLADHALCTHGH
jgi:DNA-binding transcriptional MerR regulator